MRWEISVRPDGDGGVNIVLPATEDCDVEGAICTGDARTLSSTLEVTIRGPHEPNSPATGAPTITGTAQVGETLTADTSGIADGDGLDNVSFAYQWVADDTDIAGATGSSYTLVAADAGKAIKVRVSFTDDEGNDETLTSAATAAVGPAAEEAVLEGELTVGQATDIFPVASGYSILGNLGGTLSPGEFAVDGTTYRVKFLAHRSESLWLGLDGELPTDFTLGVGDAAYLGSESMDPPAIRQPGVYWWPSEPPDWSADDPVRVSLTIRPKVPLGDRPKAPVTGYFRNFPSHHDGKGDFTFRIYFSEGVAATAEAMRDHVLAVSSGSVSRVQAVGNEGRIWAVSVTPDGTYALTVGIEAELDCEMSGAICTADRRQAAVQRMELEVVGGRTVYGR